MLREAGGDVTKKSNVVNQVAETLSRINRVEDFTKQQDYIRQCAGILRIDENGLTTLVNKYKRERLAKEEKQLPFETNRQQAFESTGQQPEHVPDEAQLLFLQDEAHERNVLRVLLEYGLRSWDETRAVAEYIFEELEQFHIETPQLEKLYETYKSQYYQGLEPNPKTLLYHDDETIRQLVTGITLPPYELSQKWDEVMEGMNILNRDTAHQDVLMSVNYFKLRKIKKMFEENQRDMETAGFDDFKRLLEVHKHLKAIETELTKKIGTVILK